MDSERNGGKKNEARRKGWYDPSLPLELADLCSFGDKRRKTQEVLPMTIGDGKKSAGDERGENGLSDDDANLNQLRERGFRH